MSEEKISLRELSREGYVTQKSKSYTKETINCGSFQRIADSLEKMEKPYEVLKKENEILNKNVIEYQNLYLDKKIKLTDLQRKTTKKLNKIFVDVSDIVETLHFRIGKDVNPEFIRQTIKSLNDINDKIGK